MVQVATEKAQRPSCYPASGFEMLTAMISALGIDTMDFGERQSRGNRLAGAVALGAAYQVRQLEYADGDGQCFPAKVCEPSLSRKRALADAPWMQLHDREVLDELNVSAKRHFRHHGSVDLKSLSAARAHFQSNPYYDYFIMRSLWSAVVTPQSSTALAVSCAVDPRIALFHNAIPIQEVGASSVSISTNGHESHASTADSVDVNQLFIKTADFKWHIFNPAEKCAGRSPKRTFTNRSVINGQTLGSASRGCTKVRYMTSRDAMLSGQKCNAAIAAKVPHRNGQDGY
jgi:hypothetical protein